MSRLADQDHNVLFVDPPINTGRVFWRQIQKGFWGIRRLLTQVVKDSTGAVIYTPLNILISQNLTSSMHIERIKSLMNKNFDNDLKTVLWVYHVQIPFLEKYVNNLPHDILVYDCVDNYLGFPDNSNFYSAIVPRSKVVEQEEFLAKNADIVFATAPGLVEKLKQYNKNVIFTPNVGDFGKFFKVSELKSSIPGDLEAIPRPRIGFTGALDSYKFDAKLVRKIAEDHPEFSFVLIGQLALKDRDAGLEDLILSDVKNVYFLGEKPYGEIEKYFAGFDAYFIPYQLNDYTVGGCFPVKFHDSLASGLPTIVTNLPAYMPFDNVSYISRSYEEFSANVKKALEEDNEHKVIERQEVARQNTWEGKIELMLKKVYEASGYSI